MKKNPEYPKEWMLPTTVRLTPETALEDILKMSVYDSPKRIAGKIINVVATVRDLENNVLDLGGVFKPAVVTLSDRFNPNVGQMDQAIWMIKSSVDLGAFGYGKGGEVNRVLVNSVPVFRTFFEFPRICFLYIDIISNKFPITEAKLFYDPDLKERITTTKLVVYKNKAMHGDYHQIPVLDSVIKKIQSAKEGQINA